jgi:type IV secretion system protein VirD4
MKMGAGESGEYDRERNFAFSHKGTYGTSGFMTAREMRGVLDTVSDIRRHHGTLLGKLDGKAVCVPADTRLNRNIAVYGASGSKKTRAFAINMVLQCALRGESLVITDPKSEIYEKTSVYLRGMGYTVKVFNLVNPENSDSWNCLAEIEGQELMAQLFCDVIIKNTGSERGDHFWDNSEMNLLKALVLYVEQGYPPKGKNIGQVYKLLTLNSEKELNGLIEALPAEHPAKAPFSIFKQASDTVRSGIIIGLGSRLQVFQNKMIRRITSRDEIDLELPGREKCRITASHPTRRALSIFSPRCSFLSCSSNWCATRISTVITGNSPCRCMCWGKSCVPAA